MALHRCWKLAASVLLVAASHLGCGSTSPSPPPPSVHGPGTESGLLTVEGGSLYYEVAGLGPTVVLIHGGFGDRRMWDAQVAALADSFRVVRYDHRGFGRSPAPDSPYSPIADLVLLLGRLGVERAHVVGNSMGGALALDFALVHPERVRSLTVVASGPNGLAAPEEDVGRVVAVFETAEREGLEATAALWLASPMVRLTSADPRTAPLLQAMVRDNAGVFRMPFRLWPDAGLDPPAAERLGEITAPALIVVGAEDTPFVREAAEYAAGGLPDAALVVLPGSDHLPQMVQPEAFNRALRAFLRAH